MKDRRVQVQMIGQSHGQGQYIRPAAMNSQGNRI
jgi:hypothetical protein